MAEVIGEIFRVNNKFDEEVIRNRIQPIIIDLLNDNDLEVKIEALKLLEPWSKVNEKSVLEVIKTILKLEHSNWRVRKYELNAIMRIAINSNKKNFHKYFRESFLLGMSDKAFEVRKHAISFIR